ncbi:lysylphosphatidylglycerol synthase domain-containing protein [Limobrevibacterium gyesilva]|uniref:Lysylphosphatidylglycerol synthase domain-containing protein n=1 Tax=Limobrevibacterium gyesilva TaxID=2991712 RepID=A0AA41YLA5_9PROT|nr:lysylphosphatidylglycerol synthase domain-containing protein [Limobrevibacterium gyesilva]MCW3475949.1 lysylphosphatidylglycerol synthase domain-containing protein [Limobrevibacterium gyesilva]
MTFGLITIVLGGGAVIGLVSWFGVQSIGHEVLQAGWVIPLTTVLLLLQLYVSAVAWRIAVGEARPRVGRYFRIRWIREAVNSLLPVAQLGGNIVGIRMLVQRGVPGPLAGAGTTLDLTIEAVTQFLFTLAGFAVLAAVAAHSDAWAPWVTWALATMALGLAGFILAQRAGLMRIIEWLASRLNGVFPALSVAAVRGLHQELIRLHQDRTALAKATGLHLLAWILGVAETWITLTAMGRPTSLAEAFVIESLGMAARSAGFVVPGALGVQEAGFIVVCDLFAIPAETAIALSMVKRARELLVGVPGLVLWQWSEGRRLLQRGQATGPGVRTPRA